MNIRNVPISPQCEGQAPFIKTLWTCFQLVEITHRSEEQRGKRNKKMLEDNKRLEMFKNVLGKNLYYV